HKCGPLLGFFGSFFVFIPLFMVFLAIYITTLMTNLGLTALISIDLQLQTPMYIFLQNLSLTDAVYSTVIIPKILATFLEEIKAISYGCCILQYFSFVLLTISECLLLAVMAYDRYVAICKPLLYTVIMTKAVCWRLVKSLYFVAFLNSLVHTSGLLKLSFCSSNVVNHFFCDISPLFLISSSSTDLNELLVFIFGSLFVMSSIITILISYFHYSDCDEDPLQGEEIQGLFHLYLSPDANNFSLDKDKIASLFYTVVIPMLNPLIYSWRNKVAKDALHRHIFTLNVHWLCMLNMFYYT
uniref:Olfactory receptor n=1 Tax=Phasianus colchicus TaxID=9054 RepID=A0A669QK18_PHACC